MYVNIREYVSLYYILLDIIIVTMTVNTVENIISEFVAKISTSGKSQIVIIIPKEFHHTVKHNMRKQIKVRLEKI